MLHFWCLLVVAASVVAAADGKENSLLLILLDGFRWDYLQLPGLKGFPRLQREGVRAEYMEALYPSESYPGYYSVATGRFGESHGMVLNYMYDADHHAFFKMEPDPVAKESFWWEDAEPLWITATRNNISTGLYLWPGGDVVIRGLKAKRVKPYVSVPGTENFRNDLEEALESIRKKEIRYAQVYCEYTDKVGHNFGPFSININRSIAELDDVMNNLLDRITEKGLQDTLHLVIVSDHGMANTDSEHAKRISLEKHLNSDDIRYVLDRGSHAGIYPLEGHMEKVYQDLKKMEGMDVYKKEDIPERFHLKRHRRAPPLFIVVRKGYFLTGLMNEKQIPEDSPDAMWNGFHGYDPKESDMNAIFLAHGPSLKRNHISPPIHITDPYNLMAHILDLVPLPNNGSWDKMENMLATNPSGSMSYFSLCSPIFTVLWIIDLVTWNCF